MLKRAVLVSGFLSVFSSSAMAEISALCTDALDVTVGYTNGAELLVPDAQVQRVRDNMLAKIEDARLKVSLDKLEDAWLKLEDLKISVSDMALAAKPKIVQQDADNIIGAASQAQTVCTGL